MDISFRELQNIVVDIRFDNFKFLYDFTKKLDYKKIDIDKSFVSIENYQEPSSNCRICFVPCIDNNHNFKLAISLDLSFHNIFLAFEDFEEVCFIERLDYCSISAYEDYFSKIVSLKFRKELWGCNENVYEVRYIGQSSEEGIEAGGEFYRFFLKKRWFWQKNNELISYKQFDPIQSPTVR